MGSLPRLVIVTICIGMLVDLLHEMCIMRTVQPSQVIDFCHDQLCQCLHHVMMVIVQIPRSEINNTQCADLVIASAPAINNQGYSCVEADIRFSHHQVVVLEAFILKCITDYEDSVIRLGNHVRTEGMITACFRNIHSNFGLDPLSIAVYQADTGYRCMHDRAGSFCDPIERNIGLGVEDIQRSEKFNTGFVSKRDRCRFVENGMHSDFDDLVLFVFLARNIGKKINWEQAIESSKRLWHRSSCVT